MWVPEMSRSAVRKRMMRRVVLVISALVVGIFLVGCGASGPHQTAPTETALRAAVGSRCLPSPLRLSAVSMQPGKALTVSSDAFACGASYRAGKTYTLTLGQVGRGSPLKLGVAPVRRDGAFKARLRIPARASPGEAYIVVHGSAFDQCNDTSSGSCAGYDVRLHVLAAITTRVVVPRVTNVVLDVAYARLHRAGLRVSFPSPFSDGDAPASPCLPTIGRQVPRGGRHVRSGTVVTLRLRRRLCSGGSPGVPIGRLPSAKVPLFVGRPIATAVAWADRHNLYWQVDKLPPLIAGNAPDLLGNYRVISQQPTVGSSLTLGIAKGGGNQGSFAPTPLILSGEPAKHQ